MATPAKNENIKVAVRVRPYNKQERSNPNKQKLMTMDGPMIVIHTPKHAKDKSDPDHKLTFDATLDSHDPGSSTFADQQRTYEVLGAPLVDSTMEGYNTCVLAYGQTGTGKTYTMMGGDTPESEGLIPRICKNLFLRLDEDPTQPNKVEVSYYEIYNEQAYDLLKTPTIETSRQANKGAHKDKGLKVREHKVLGPYIEGLTKLASSDYAGISAILAKGNTNRHVGSTAMNAHSSRSHAVLSIAVHKATIPGTAEDDPANVSGKMNLVDLAGSERQTSTGAIGAQLKEGNAINNALTTLGVVIYKLSKRKPGHAGKVHIPYRDSNLTWLLKDSLGGNSRTTFVAALGPHASHFEETLATLRYVNHAKHISNGTYIAEDTNAKLIRELQEHVVELEAAVSDKAASDIAAQQAAAQLAINQAMIEGLNKNWAEKLAHTAEELNKQQLLDAELAAKDEALARRVALLDQKLKAAGGEGGALELSNEELQKRLFEQTEQIVGLEEALEAEKTKVKELERINSEAQGAVHPAAASKAARFLNSDADLGEQLKFLLGQTTEDTKKFLDLAIYIQCSVESLSGRDDMRSDQDPEMIANMQQLEASLSKTLGVLTHEKITQMTGFQSAAYFQKLPTDASINKAARLRHLKFEDQDENATWTYLHAKPETGDGAAFVTKRLMADV